MKKAILITTMALFGSFAIAQDQQPQLDNLLGTVTPKRITAFSSVFKETSAKYAADYTAFVEAYKTSSNKVDLVKQYLPKLEKAHEAAQAETVAENKLAQREAVLAKTKGFITALKKIVDPAASAK